MIMNTCYALLYFFYVFLKTGVSLPPEDIISNLSVHDEAECSFRCIQESTCMGYNYRPAMNSYAVNCQLSNKTQVSKRGGEREDGRGEWTFYQDPETVSA